MFTVTCSAQTVQGNGSPRKREAPPKCRVVCVYKFALRFLLGAKINRGIRISPNENKSPLVRPIAKTPAAKLIVSPDDASKIAWRSVPAPLSLALNTVRVAPCATAPFKSKALAPEATKSLQCHHGSWARRAERKSAQRDRALLVRVPSASRWKGGNISYSWSFVRKTSSGKTNNQISFGLSQ
jgi:hypothetical protein